MKIEIKNDVVSTRGGETLKIVNHIDAGKLSEDLVTLSNGKTYKIGVAFSSGFLRFEDEGINKGLEEEKEEEEKRRVIEEERRKHNIEVSKELERLKKKEMEDAITEFRGEYNFLSNFYGADVTYKGITYHNNEAAFQAQKDVSRAQEFATLTNPVVAKRNGRKVHLRPDWEEVKVGIMEEIVRCKFTQHPELRKKLLDTGDRLLLEGGKDNFWGNSKNALGKILMKVRSELRLEEDSSREGN